MDNSAQPMRDKICLVTGATSGIGQVTARVLAEQGARVIIAGRNQAKCAATVSQIQQQTGNRTVEYLLADLSSQQAVRQLAQEFKNRYWQLHVLVNNAGAIFFQRQTTVDGLEMTFGLNHLSCFLLTHLLLDMIQASALARIVNVASRAHERARINFDDLQGTKSYNAMRAYGQSKLGNVLFTYELARRLAGTRVTANALHPGVVGTGFAANNGSLVRLGLRLYRFFALSPEQGAQTSTYLATSPEVEGITGKYFVDRQAVPSSPLSYDTAVASRLWQVSAEMTGLPGTI
jgi:NAD(P)-dependent dehydrogenase (short-subunit alcohol dehydrogenase family)